MKWALLILCAALSGCASSGALDWPALARGATPEFRTGNCGPEVVWIKTVAVYETAEVEARLIVRPKCKEVEK